MVRILPFGSPPKNASSEETSPEETEVDAEEQLEELDDLPAHPSRLISFQEDGTGHGIR